MSRGTMIGIAAAALAFGLALVVLSRRTDIDVEDCFAIFAASALLALLLFGARARSHAHSSPAFNPTRVNPSA